MSQPVSTSASNVANCVVIDNVMLCYKKIDDILDWETLQNIYVLLKRIDDRVRKWLDIIKQELDNSP